MVIGERREDCDSVVSPGQPPLRAKHLPARLEDRFNADPRFASRLQAQLRVCFEVGPAGIGSATRCDPKPDRSGLDQRPKSSSLRLSVNRSPVAVSSSAAPSTTAMMSAAARVAADTRLAPDRSVVPVLTP
jgi:hypothetical protein